MLRRRIAVVGLVALSAVAGPSGARAVTDGVDIGGNPSLPTMVNACGPGTTWIQDTAAVAPSYTTTAGVVTSWSVMPGALVNPGVVTLKIVREGPADAFTVTGTATPQQLTPDRLNSFRTRIPVVGGDVLGLYVAPQLSNSGCDYNSGNGGDSVRFVPGSTNPNPALGDLLVAQGQVSGERVDVAAHIEPDGDGDGYGDLTQDACTALKNSHDDCTPPDTFLKSGPPRKLTTRGSSTKVKIGFFASEPTATFTCRLDKAPAKPCNSTFKTKVRTGKHKVTITATDAVGNVDPTPLVVRFKVARTR